MYKSFTKQNAIKKAQKLLKLDMVYEATIHPAEDHWAFGSQTEKQQAQHQGKFCVCLQTDNPCMTSFIDMGAIVTNQRQIFAVARIK